MAGGRVVCGGGSLVFWEQGGALELGEERFVDGDGVEFAGPWRAAWAASWGISQILAKGNMNSVLASGWVGSAQEMSVGLVGGSHARFAHLDEAFDPARVEVDEVAGTAA